MPDLSCFFSLQGLVYTNLLQLLFLFLLIAQRGKLQRSVSLEMTQLRELFIEQVHQLEMVISENASNSQQRLYELIIQNQLSAQELITKNIQQQMTDIREQINFSFRQHANGLTSHLHSLTEEIRNHLQQLTQQVNHKLAEGFEKTSSTFTDVVRRLTIIDEAQKKITELSTHVVSLQDVLQDKRSRGAFGEVQLNVLIANMLPSTHYQMQYTLSNQKRADCILFLPEPTGQVVIDAKFPLETYQKLINSNCSLADKKILQQQFRQDVSKHIKDIAEKYIISGETSDGAMMFIPAEAIFAEIHANYPEVVALSQRLKVWLVSPSTLMAVLTTAKAVLKDDATRKQVHIIQKHLHALADDFQRFEKRMDKLSKHIDQAHQDVDEVSTSARKITQRFQRIESVDLLITDDSKE
ncbi:DNA recombination protein RmuC [Legionella quinlivanii]|uniref:DNA recombination protein RmuC n=1 Tax=Legionella quinlivanii TaxID=45073 RepID=UPI0022432083|nr:DNA recombination protein RmuC [Legionella quinlivanii]MCW8450258.1 DNA recombination protein RmuC [Legionella quinlivanii]